MPATHAWVTHAPADYALVFLVDPDGDHAVVSADLANEYEVSEAVRRITGLEIGPDRGVRVYCTLAAESDDVLAQLRDAGADATLVERGTIAFVAVGDGTGTSTESVRRGRHRVVLSHGGDAPRHYHFRGQCGVCGDLLGTVHVLPGDETLLDARSLSCRCRSIACRYCEDGWVRRPLTEHVDPERRAGCVPWFGYLVPCGGFQAAGQGPEVWMSGPAAGSRPVT